MPWKTQLDDRGNITRWRDTDSGEVLSDKDYQRRQQMAGMGTTYPMQAPQMTAMPAAGGYPQVYAGGNPYGAGAAPAAPSYQNAAPSILPGTPAVVGAPAGMPGGMPGASPLSAAPPIQTAAPAGNPLIQPGARMMAGGAPNDMLAPGQAPQLPAGASPIPGQDVPATAGQPQQAKTLRILGNLHPQNGVNAGYKQHGFLDATSIAILLPTLVLLALIIAAAHKKRLFPWQTIRTFNPPSGLMAPKDYERSYLCPPNLRRHGRLGKRNPKATWTEADGVVLPFGFLARTHLPVTIPMGRLPNKNMFIVAPSGSGKTTLMRAIIKALLAKPCVIIALEAKANDPNLDEKREGFKYSLLPEAEHAGFDALYFNPLDSNSIHWNPLDLDPISFASSIVQDVNSLPPEEQHWAERDHGYIYGLAQILKWGAVQVSSEDENGSVAEVVALPSNPRGLMKLVNNRRNIVESLRRLKSNPEIDAAELSEMTQMLSSIIRTDSDWDKNIQGIRGRLRMFKNPNVMRVTERSNIDLRACMHKPTVLIFGAPASLGPDAESLAACFVYQLQQALHTRYGTKSVLPLFAFFDEYQTLNIDLAGRLSAIVRGANGGLTVILQNIGQIDSGGGGGGGQASAELKTIFSNASIRVCLHNADETTAAYFSEEIGKHAVVVPGIADHYMANGFGIFPTSWNRIHSQQVVARVDPDSIKRMEKHHALVYLSPAGDPEFGEVKPLMCDLRGIEEIARLHLLHNVGPRLRPDAGGPDGHGGPEGPNGGGDGQTPPANDFTPPAQVQYPPGMGLPTSVQYPAQPSPQFPAPGPAQPAAHPGQAAALAAQIPTMAMPAMGQQPAAAPANGNGNGARTCGTCGKNAGKGKFCIECGAFVGATPAPAAAPAATADGARVELATTAAVAGQQPAQAPAYAPAADPSAPTFPTFARPAAAAAAEPQGVLKRASLLESPQQIAQAAQEALGSNAYAAPTAAPAAPGQPQPAAPPGVIQGAKRQPVTSFNLDPSRLGYSYSPAPAGEAGKPGGAQGGVEF